MLITMYNLLGMYTYICTCVNDSSHFLLMYNIQTYQMYKQSVSHSPTMRIKHLKRDLIYLTIRIQDYILIKLHLRK